jgi:aminoglycoside phosphotransferase (APT) family kinase protein
MLQRVRIGPPLIAADGPRVLLAEVPGEDLHRPSRGQVATLVDLLVGEQVRWIDRTAELLALGLPDWRAEVFVPLATDVVSRTADQLDPGTVTAAGALVEDLPRRFADLASCGVPDTLVHGDFHAGNARGDEGRCVVLDWGDSGVGHPLLDMAAAVEPLAPELVRVAQDAWTAAWRHAVPGCDPPRAAALVAPVAALRQAVIYRHFLDHIEPAEQPYHRADPARWIIRAVSSVVSARGARGT